MIVPFESLVAFAREVLVSAGASREDAQEVALHLVRADASGRPSHGIRVLGEYVGTIKDGTVDTHARIEHVVDLGGVVVLDGGYGFGQATGRAALELAASRAAEHGVGCVLARRAGDVGRVGDYTERLADRSLASIMLVAGHAYGGRIAPWGGAEGRFPNDVISLGFPGGADPFVVDMALGAAALRRIRMAHERGESIPDEWVITADGSPTTSPVDIDRGGRLLPAAGHKGYGLIVLVELLAGLLSGAGLPAGEYGEHGNSFLLIAIDAGRLVPHDEAAAQLAAFRDYVKSSPTLPGFATVSLPGEQSSAGRRRAEAEGVELHESTWAGLRALAAETSVPLPGGSAHRRDL